MYEHCVKSHALFIFCFHVCLFSVKSLQRYPINETPCVVLGWNESPPTDYL